MAFRASVSVSGNQIGARAVPAFALLKQLFSFGFPCLSATFGK